MPDILSASASELAAIVARSSASHVARVVGVDEASVRGWVAGRVPKASMRAKLQAFDERLRPSGWSLSAGGAVPAVPPIARPRRAVARVAGATSSEERLLEVIRECDALLEEAADPSRHASVRDKCAILGAKSSAVVRLSKIAEDSTWAKILDSAEWQEILSVITDVMSKAPPELMREIADRLQAAEDDAVRRGTLGLGPTRRP